MRRHAGTPLKRIVLRFGGRAVPGEAVLTAEGVEGGPFYALGAGLRDAILRDGVALAEIDLRPDLSLDELRRRLEAPRRAQSLSTFLRKAAGLPPVCSGAAAGVRRRAAKPRADLARAIKALPLRLTGLAGLERAISTAGGLRLDAALRGRRILRWRDAGLGGADRRVPAAGGLQHGICCRRVGATVGAGRCGISRRLTKPSR